MLALGLFGILFNQVIHKAKVGTIQVNGFGTCIHQKPCDLKRKDNS